jgi:cephalosporin hydroxylase
MPNSIKEYLSERDEQIKETVKTKELEIAASNFMEQLVKANYIKRFTWAGVPIIQMPTDLMAIQEIMWQIKPDIVIETGVAWGGSLLFSANILAGIGHGRVIGIDVDVRQHTLDAIAVSPLRNWITVLESDSTSSHLIKTLHSSCRNKTVLILLDSCHSHAHVLQELRLYAPLVSVGSYIIVFDTAIHFYGHLDNNQDRPWNKQDNPYLAVQEFLLTDMGKNFIIDKDVEVRALLTSAPGGWLRRIK